MTEISNQWIRKVGLFVHIEDNAIDLSEFHIRFNTVNADNESPNNCSIRIYNPTMETVMFIRSTAEFSRVVLNAGYISGNYGVIFDGTIKQFRLGKENNTTTYLDILASDGDIGYNQGFIAKSLARGTTNFEALKEASNAMNQAQLDGKLLKTDAQHVPSLRGQVMFGMARSAIRNLATTLDASWSLQNGSVVITDYKGYDDTEIVELNAGTGLVGIPEQTNDGIHLRCLLNPRLRIGGGVKINNADLNQLFESSPKNAAVRYNSWSLYNNAPINADGVYRMFVVEHEGDTRGNTWYSNIVALDVDLSVPENIAVNRG